jgi:hypothetical protein
MKPADAIREFNAVTADRLPTLGELFELCDSCGLRFRLKDGEPLIAVPGACASKCGRCDYCRANAMARPVAEVVQELIRSEPWRSQVIAHRLEATV